VLQRGERALAREPVKRPKHYHIDIPPSGSFKESLELGTVCRPSAHVINKIKPFPLLCLNKALHLKKLIVGFLSFGGDAQVHAGAPDRILDGPRTTPRVPDYWRTLAKGNDYAPRFPMLTP
jgi:hypothetical protein